MLRQLGLAGCLIVVLLATLPAAHPQDQPQPVFRGGVSLVYVDVYPRRDGHLVEGLAADDFQVFEDGKPQKVEGFEFIRTEPNAPDAARMDPNSKREGDELAADPHNRVFVFYLDLFHMNFGDPGTIRGPLTEFINRTISPTDVFAVVTPRTPDPVSQLVFVRRTDSFEADLSRWVDQWIAITRETPTELALENCDAYCFPPAIPLIVQVYREDLMATSLQDLMARLGKVRDERKNVVLITEGWAPQPRATGLEKLLTPASPPRIGTTPGTGRLGVGVPELGTIDHNWCNQQIGRLSALDFHERFKELLHQANRANVAFYPVDVGGLRVNLPDASYQLAPGQLVPPAQQMLDSGRAKIDTLRTLAENTDGLAIVNTNDMRGGFGRISDELSGYYLLGYSSTNAALDGRYREIKVKINRPGVSMTARRGYLAPTLEARKMAAAGAATAVPSTVTGELARLSRSLTDSDLFGYGTKTAGGLDLVVELASGPMGQVEWQKGAEVRATVTAAGAQPVVVTGRIDSGARAVLLHVPVAATDRGPWRANLRASTGSNVLEGQLEIEGRPDAQPLLGEPIAYRGTASARVPLRPVADFRFRRTERLHVEWPVLTLLDQRVARVFDRRGQPIALNVALTQSTPTTLAADVLLAPLAEGDYLIELTGGAGGKTGQRLVAFRVVRGSTDRLV